MDISDSLRNGCGLLKVWTQTFGGPFRGDGQWPFAAGGWGHNAPPNGYATPLHLPSDVCLFLLSTCASESKGPMGWKSGVHPSKTKLKKKEKGIIETWYMRYILYTYIHTVCTYILYVHLDENPSSVTVRILFCFHEWKCISGEFCKYAIMNYFLFLNK